MANMRSWPAKLWRWFRNAMLDKRRHWEDEVLLRNQ